MFTRPTALIRPSMPVVWSKWPWLQTTASIEPGSMSSRRMFSTTPSGLVPASNSTGRRAVIDAHGGSRVRVADGPRCSRADLVADGRGDLLGPGDDRVRLALLGDHLQARLLVRYG